jgi:hypothetical protein
LYKEGVVDLFLNTILIMLLLMMKRRSLVSDIDMSTIISFDSASDNYESLGANYDQALDAYAPTLNVGSSSMRPPHREDFPYKKDVYTGKYIAQ